MIWEAFALVFADKRVSGNMFLEACLRKRFAPTVFFEFRHASHHTFCCKIMHTEHHKFSGTKQVKNIHAAMETKTQTTENTKHESISKQMKSDQQLENIQQAREAYKTHRKKHFQTHLKT